MVGDSIFLSAEGPFLKARNAKVTFIANGQSRDRSCLHFWGTQDKNAAVDLRGFTGISCGPRSSRRNPFVQQLHSTLQFVFRPQKRGLGSYQLQVFAQRIR